MNAVKRFSWCILSACIHMPALATTWYAKPAATGAGDCTSWANACTLAVASNEKAAIGDEVWVHSGIYPPIILKNGVRLIGGFAGTETSASQSAPDSLQTIIDGAGAQAVTCDSAGSATVLRGFLIRNGVHSDITEGGGGGLYLKDSSALIVQCVFQDNSSSGFGGAVAIFGAASPQFVNCEFRHNGATTTAQPIAGGAVYVEQSTATFTNCLLVNNKAGEGGAIAIESGAVIMNNCTVTNNEATVGSGGAIFDQAGASTIRNCIFWNNTAVRGNSHLYNKGGQVSSVASSVVGGGWSGTGNLDTDPLFTQGHHLQQSSPCKNTGQNGYLPADVADLDWDGNTSEPLPKDLGMSNRKIQLTVDMGCYETPISGGS